MTTQEAQVLQYEFEIEIKATPSRVWKALTGQLSQWWLPDFHTLGTDSLVTLEPMPGGRLYEENGDRGLLWYTVLAIAPGESLSLAGQCTSDWGGPYSSQLVLKLAESGQGTRLTVSDALFGRVDANQVKSSQSGWQLLFDEGLRKFVETA